MSSSTSVRRVKERGGAGGKITAQRPLRTIAENQCRQKESLGSSKKPSGRENTRPVSGSGTPKSCQKPVGGRMWKAAPEAAAAGKEQDPRIRRSSSSEMKGTTTNISDFSRILLDLRSGRTSRGSSHDRVPKPLGRSEDSVLIAAANSFRGLEKCHLKKSSSVSIPEGKGAKLVRSSSGQGVCSVLDVDLKDNERNGPRVVVEEDCKHNVLLLSDVKSSAPGAFSGAVDHNFPSNINVLHEKPSNTIRASTNSTNSSLCSASSFQESDPISSKNFLNGESSSDEIHTDFKFAEKFEKLLGDVENSRNSEKEGTGGQIVNKYRSKLHEKLAYLEGRVKRIASDIERTKEMLDMNDPEASKVMLSDIREKISGIEKAMSHVEDDGKHKGSDTSTETVQLQSRHLDKMQDLRGAMAGNSKNSVKGLNHEELEARLFPHHKLLRSRTSLGNLAGKEGNVGPNFPEVMGDSGKRKESLSSIDENPIALEFLASLDEKNLEIYPENSCDQLVCSAIQEMNTAGDTTKPDAGVSKKLVSTVFDEGVTLTSNENLDEFDDQENNFPSVVREEGEESCANQLREIGRKSATGGWFINEGESVLLAHDDGSCSFHDCINSDEKAMYLPPLEVPHNLWGDCWLIFAAGSDGLSGKYVIAASAGHTLDAGFCSWDFYTKQVQAFHVEDGIRPIAARTVLSQLPICASSDRRGDLCSSPAPADQQWWYKPCGPLIGATSTSQKGVSMYDIRDGELVMKWETPMPVLKMDYSSPLQWRNRGKMVIADTEAISLWDVNSLRPQSLLSIATVGKNVSALHVNNTEAELGGGIRRRVSSSETQGNDGVFCTEDTISVVDFRVPSGVGLMIPKQGLTAQCISSHGDRIFLGSTDARASSSDEPARSLVQHFSVRKGQLVSTYALPVPALDAHNPHHSRITQVWGDSCNVMAACGMGLFVFDTSSNLCVNEAHPSLSFGHHLGEGAAASEVKEVIGPNNLCSPTFDYLESRVLLISRDRPAHCRYLS